MTNAPARDSRPKWNALLERVNELKDIEGLIGLFQWEDETYAPSGGRRARGPQMATIRALHHRKLVDPSLAELLTEANPATAEERVLVARTQRHVDQATKIPERLVKAMAEATAASLPAWEEARSSADFKKFEPHLSGLLPLVRERAAALGTNGIAYNALLDEFEPETTVADIQPLFDALKAGLVPLAERIAAAPPPKDDFLRQPFDDEKQWQFTLQLLRDFGFEFEHGRQDRSTHPFTASVNEQDVRVTTRIEETNLMCAISSTIHECGHALYEQGFDPQHYRTYLAAAPSMGIHESQSRLWENQVGLSRPFWQHYFPVLQAAFPEQLSGLDLDVFWPAVNRVRPSFIRVDADEVTYNLHILVRFELELALIAGDLQVADLPGAWNEKMQALLGITPPDDAKGCLQDIHWACGSFGYFPTYTLGNLYAAQLFSAFAEQHPSHEADFAAGRFAPLLSWLRQNVHRRGHTASAQEIVKDAVGAPISVAPFLTYLEAKYARIYDLAG